MIFTLAKQELRTLFSSPLAWTLLAVIQFILTYLFVLHIDRYLLIQGDLAGLPGAPGISDRIIAPLFKNAMPILLLAVPLLSMGTISGERRKGTLCLLFSAPLSLTEIIVGKYLGQMIFWTLLVGLLALLPLTLLLGNPHVDLGRVAATLLGLELLLASFCAIGLYFSSLTRHPSVAASATLGLLMLLWMIDLANPKTSDGGLSQYLSLFHHYEPFLLGEFSSNDLCYYLLLIFAFLGLAIHRLHRVRRMG